MGRNVAGCASGIDLTIQNQRGKMPSMDMILFWFGAFFMVYIYYLAFRVPEGR